MRHPSRHLLVCLGVVLTGVALVASRIPAASLLFLACALMMVAMMLTVNHGGTRNNSHTSNAGDHPTPTASTPCRTS